MGYINLIGHVQSGKTNEEIQFCKNSLNNNLPVIFLTRNITYDQLQLVNRIKEFDKQIIGTLRMNNSALAMSIGFLPKISASAPAKSDDSTEPNKTAATTVPICCGENPVVASK